MNLFVLVRTCLGLSALALDIVTGGRWVRWPSLLGIFQISVEAFFTF